MKKSESSSELISRLNGVEDPDVRDALLALWYFESQETSKSQYKDAYRKALQAHVESRLGKGDRK